MQMYDSRQHAQRRCLSLGFGVFTVVKFRFEAACATSMPGFGVWGVHSRQGSVRGSMRNVDARVGSSTVESLVLMMSGPGHESRGM